ncbi:HI0074 family nucleotidyltransferase substrate-binding subunit [Lamprobacter modestohalophilus]|uniref:HI0074 family nucleotidyltransferase substrate-binding subunit n=1 Tax=Lamprobacter modestohalophilus TaxID=1064514 RepID=UPI002ADED7F5|nr:HI0074 family nucleotidyltransferase substrate-binding subunit [Lamprobacter modestohalophilus]MEA1051051.1 HI0074 family nucleotidyltransferase substrate-binding subunit [Lamprobacter modestohalophilus]
MDIERLNERIADFLKGVYQLERAVAQPFDEFTRDATIQRFEFCYELAWKMLKLRLEQEGISALSPRQALREALQAALIGDGNVWSEIQRYRNLTSHTYDERLANEVYAFIADTALVRFQTLAREAEAWKTR